MKQNVRATITRLLIFVLAVVVLAVIFRRSATLKYASIIGHVTRSNNQSCPLKTTFEPFKVLTYNTQLIGDTTGALTDTRTDRRDALISYLQNSDAKVVCLQETYIGPDVEAVVNGLSAQFPHSYSQIHYFNGILPPQVTGVRVPVCDLTAVTTLLFCLTVSGCIPVTSPQTFATCVSTKCKTQFKQVLVTGKSNCATCLLTVGLTNLNACTGAANHAVWDINPSGLLLLSKLPLTNRMFTPYHRGVAQSLERGILQAKIYNEITIACTHPSPGDQFSYEAFLEPSFPTSRDAHNFEIDIIVQRLRHVNNVLLMGDINAGPRLPNVNALNPESYQKLLTVFNTDIVKSCTYCKSNVHNTNDTGAVDVTIDHIFGSKHINISDSKVVLKVDDASITSQGNVLPLSDHYGTIATVSCQCDQTTGRTERHYSKSRYHHRGRQINKFNH